MNTNKIALLIIAIVAIGIFALPSTVSLFSGQHTWYKISDVGNQLPCEKCHQDIQDEMVSGDNGVHKNLDAPGCNCHRVTPPETRISTGVAEGSGGGIPGTTAHAAATIACMICHEQGLNYPFAGGFNQSAVYDGTSVPPDERYYYNHSDDSGGEHAAHNAFINQAINDTLMEDSNEACIACHTRVGVNISWTKNEYLEFTAGEDKFGNWTVEDFAAGGDNETQVNYSNDWTE
ncbi:MAG: hypothetical protein KAT65_02090 [Methanophagales archaeon]|nr:hypothetical protein [Methanophagales archaeon]